MHILLWTISGKQITLGVECSDTSDIVITWIQDKEDLLPESVVETNCLLHCYALDAKMHIVVWTATRKSLSFLQIGELGYM